MYQKTFKVDESGIVGISILATGESNKSLEVGKRYVRSFSMVCEPDDRSPDTVVKGFVQRIAPQPTLNSDLANPDPMTWLEGYAKNEFGTKLSLLNPKGGDRYLSDARPRAKRIQLLQSQGLESVLGLSLVESL